MIQSFWKKKNWALTPHVDCDVLIVGGGFVGLSTAYWISELNPDKKVIVVERSQCGEGASGKNAGFLTKGSALFYHKLIEQWGEEQALSVYNYASESLSLLKQHILASSEIRYESTNSVTFLRSQISLPTAFEFREAEQCHLLPGVIRTLVGENEFKINPRELLGAMTSTLSRRGIEIIEGTSAFEITEHGVKTNVNTISAGTIVLAVNGYAGEFHPSLRELVRPARAQMLALEIAEDTPWTTSLYYDPTHRVYFRSERPGLLLLGGKRLLDEEEEFSSVERLSPIIQKALEEYAQQELGLQFKVLQRWTGIMGLTPHELPYVDTVNAPMKTILAVGFSGHGMGLGFHAGKESAELALGLRKESFFSRFGSPNLVWK